MAVNLCGYMFRFQGKNLYFAGDTGVMADMELFPRLFGKLQQLFFRLVHIIPCVSRKASFAAAELLKTKRVIGCHFDTFEPIKINHDSAKQLFAERNIEFSIPELGEEFEV